MKSITLKNQDLIPAIMFLKSLSMSGKPTRGKQKFIERLIEKNKEYGNQEEEVVADFCELGEDGKPVVTEGFFKIREDLNEEENKEMLTVREELSEEEVVILFMEYSEKYESLFESLDKWEEDIPSQYSYIYDKLMDEYEKQEEN